MSRLLLLSGRQCDRHFLEHILEIALAAGADRILRIIAPLDDSLWAESTAGMLMFGLPDCGLSGGWWFSQGSGADNSRDEWEDLGHHCHSELQLPLDSLCVESDLLGAVAQSVSTCGLIVVTSRSQHRELIRPAGLKSLLERAYRPVLIGPVIDARWRRIVVVPAHRHEQEELVAWGLSWARLLNLPLRLVAHRADASEEHVRHELLAILARYDLDAAATAMSFGCHSADVALVSPRECLPWRAGDLCLVGRRSLQRPLPFGRRRTLDRFLKHFPGTVGVLPSFYTGAVQKWLFPGMATSSAPRIDSSEPSPQVA